MGWKTNNIMNQCKNREITKINRMNKWKFIVLRKINLKFRTAHSLRKNHRLFTRVSVIRKSLILPSIQTTKIKPSLKTTIHLKIKHMKKDLHTK
jgi:hypothetical protein